MHSLGVQVLIQEVIQDMYQTVRPRHLVAQKRINERSEDVFVCPRSGPFNIRWIACDWGKIE